MDMGTGTERMIRETTLYYIFYECACPYIIRIEVLRRQLTCFLEGENKINAQALNPLINQFIKTKQRNLKIQSNAWLIFMIPSTCLCFV